VERRTVDIRGQVCPMTWVRVKLALEAASPGEHLEVLLRGEEPVRNVPRAAVREGHEVVELAAVEDYHRLVLRRC
jgi:tRNA 2-thiouridine synthesizing protein A